jgi:5'-3' exonuclease
LLLHALVGCDYIKGGVHGIGLKKGKSIVAMVRWACKEEKVPFGATGFYRALRRCFKEHKIADIDAQTERVNKGKRAFALRSCEPSVHF